MALKQSRSQISNYKNNGSKIHFYLLLYAIQACLALNAEIYGGLSWLLLYYYRTNEESSSKRNC